MAASNKEVFFSGLAPCLIRHGVIAEEIALKAQKQAAEGGLSFVSYLVTNKLADGLAIATLASQEYGVPLFDLDTIDPDVVPVDMLSDKLITRHRIAPLFQRGRKFFVAVSDPTNLRALDEIKFTSGMLVEPILVEESKLTRFIERFLDANDTTLTDILDSDLDGLEFELEDQSDDDKPDIDLDDAPVVRFVNKVLVDAIKQGASDIHIEPYEKSFRTRFRIDGILHEVSSAPIALASRITTRIKVMSAMDIAERRVPQDGRIRMKLSKRQDIDFRVNTLPTLYGEKVVLRLLDGGSAQLGIEDLGLDPKQKQEFLDAVSKPHGMVLVTGPTGSGKTVTLYTAVNILNTPKINISTAEDPVEIQVPGVNQVNVKPKIGFDFAAALRAFLRQDPDVIMVGEIRDLETAEIAVKAAQTGHLVLSTLHTNDAPQTIVRLANMGVPAFNIASSVNLIVAQRLARRLCATCKVPVELPPDLLHEEGFDGDASTVYGPKGCEYCTDGYKGRLGLFEVMPVSEMMQQLILKGGDAMEIKAQAIKEGMVDLRQSGLLKVAQGLTSLDEINRVTKD